MQDKLTDEISIIEQHIQTALQKCISDQLQDHIVRLPLTIYQWTTSLFKRQQQVTKFILQYCLQNYYIKDINAFAQSPNHASMTPYFLLIKQSSCVVQCLSQVFMRVFILGVSISLGEKRKQEGKYKMKQLIKSLQIQLVLNSSQSFSDLVIKELQLISETFGCIQLFEELRNIFSKCHTFQILEWIERQMEQRRIQFYKKLELPNSQPKVAQQKKIIKKRVTINTLPNLNEQVTSTPLKSNAQTKINKSSLKDKTSQKQNQREKVEKIPLSILAKKARQSIGSNHKSLPKLPHRFIFRSTKKESRQQQQFYESPTKEECVQKGKVSLFVVRKGVYEQQQGSSGGALGCETPPQDYVRNRRLTQ